MVSEDRWSRRRDVAEIASLTIGYRSFCLFQYVCVGALVVLGLAFYLYADGRDDSTREALYGLLELFDPDNETSLTTSFSVLNLLVASVLLFIVHRHAKRFGEPMAVHWLLLALLLFGLSIDEGAAIHERAGFVFYEVADLDLPFIRSNRWVLAGALFTAVVAAFFVPFLLKLDSDIRLRFAFAGAVFVFGALGLEFVGALMMYSDGVAVDDLANRLRGVAEEGCELFAIAFFNCTVLNLIHRRGMSLRIGTGN